MERATGGGGAAGEGGQEKQARRGVDKGKELKGAEERRASGRPSKPPRAARKTNVNWMDSLHTQSTIPDNIL